MTTRSRSLTKSRFKLGWECPTKLYYYDHRETYHNLSLKDPFLQGLADGGYQVGELARWMLCEDPKGDLVDTLDKEKALAETARRLASDNVSIAEAAFRYGTLFIRADVVVKEGCCLKLYEVKSKSWDASVTFWTERGERRIRSEWAPYLLDIAFQKYVVQKASPDLAVHAFLVMPDKGKRANVDDLNQKFPVVRPHGRPEAKSIVGSRGELGDDVLVYVNVDRDIDDIRGLSMPLPDGSQGNLEELVGKLSGIYEKDEQFFCGVGTKCKTCQFRLPSKPQEAADLRAQGRTSGLEECWEHAAGCSYSASKPKVIEVWNYRKTDEKIGEGKFFVEDLSQEDIGTGRQAPRQWRQVEKVRHGDATPWIDKDQLSARMAQWKFPLHFIDFETARMALPGRKGAHPYTQVAFQFSHHAVDHAGQVRHAGEWIEPRPGCFPSFEFVRALKLQLEEDDGTIFRYAPHENTVLRDILHQLESSSEPDRQALIKWISSITECKPEGGKTEDKVKGPRNMVDMRDLVVGCHYDPATHGSNSLKAVLPAIISSSESLRARYGCALGKSGIHSLNYQADWVWVLPAKGNDPYAALPPVFNEKDEVALSDYVKGLEELDDGGAATIAYAKLQFFDLPDNERNELRNALLRYCELDTLAMVMLYEYWRTAIA